MIALDSEMVIIEKVHFDFIAEYLLFECQHSLSKFDSIEFNIRSVEYNNSMNYKISNQDLMQIINKFNYNSKYTETVKYIIKNVNFKKLNTIDGLLLNLREEYLHEKVENGNFINLIPNIHSYYVTKKEHRRSHYTLHQLYNLINTFCTSPPDNYPLNEEELESISNILWEIFKINNDLPKDTPCNANLRN